MGKAKQGLYATQPAVPAKKIAGTNPIPTLVIVGSETPRLIPWKQPRIAGYAGPHGYGHLLKHRSGHLRLSGNKKAHRIGKGK